MNLWQNLTRSGAPITLGQAMQQMMAYNGLNYPLSGVQQTLGSKTENIDQSFTGYVQGAYKSNGVVFACMLARMLLFSEARFQFRQRRSGRPGDLFGTEALALLETPWTNGTTGDLLARAIQDVDLCGNFYAYNAGDRLVRMRPDWVTIALGSPGAPTAPVGALDTEVLGYLYYPGGQGSGAKPVSLRPEQVAHFAPIPDPVATYRGMSWLQPIVNEILADQAATTHKQQFFENGATANMIVTLDSSITPDMVREFQEIFEAGHRGLENAYSTIFLGGGADAKVVGADMQQIDFKVTQGGGETRIAAAAGVPPVIVGLSEGLQSATYSNYSQARRRFADGTMRPLWRNIAGSLQSIIDVPVGAELWYDDRDIPFLAEDVKDAAEVQQSQAVTIRELINAGYDPGTVVDAVLSGDFQRLSHTGLVSVQLQPPGSMTPSSNGSTPALPAPSTN